MYLGLKTHKGGAVSLGGKDDTHRIVFIVFIVLIFMGILLYRAYTVQIQDREVMVAEGNKFLIGSKELPISRGMISDRFGMPLAANGAKVDMEFSPYDYAEEYYRVKKRLKNAETDTAREYAENQLKAMDLARLAEVSGISLERLQKSVAINETVDVDDDNAVRAVMPYQKDAQGKILRDKEGNPLPLRWFELMKEATPEQAKPLQDLDFAGVSRKLYQRRYYLQGEIVSQIVGYAGVTDNNPTYRGLSGIEQQYETALAGQKGKVQILKGKRGTSLKELQEIQPALAGQDISLTIDSRLQYILYKELENLVQQQTPIWASGIITDIHTGEVLAMGSWPSFNNNDSKQRIDVLMRNRPLLDSFESGSVMKPFTVALALESGKYNPNTKIDTTPGTMKVGGVSIFDGANYGVINLPTLIQKSSNVASAKVALSFPVNAVADMQRKFGFGKKTPIGFPAETAGKLVNPSPKDESKRATLAYGYGQEVSLAQLAQAYGVFGTKGVLHPLRLVKDAPKTDPIQVIKPQTADAILQMMELVTMKGGTGEQAAIDGYRVAGKTGTARRYLSQEKKYSKESHRNLFAGLAPASNPRFAVVILAEDPKKDKIAGKSVAPTFAKVMEETLRLYDIPYDKPILTDTSQKPN